MDIFSTPHWESNKVGDKNANDLFGTSIRKQISKKLKPKNKKKNKIKNLDRSSKDAITNKPNIHSRKIPKFFESKKKVKKESGVLNTKKNTKWEDSKPKILNRVEGVPKSKETVQNKIQKQKVKRSKKKDKIIANGILLVNQAPKKKWKPEKPESSTNIDTVEDTNLNIEIKYNHKDRLINLLRRTPILEKKEQNTSLRERMLEKLKASRFRYINEQIYNSENKEAQQYFKKDPDAFLAYHEGYRQQVSKWPLNPVDIIIGSIKKMPIDYIIADLGCGEAKLAQSIPQKVHSFDLVSANRFVTACDMSHVPLEKESVDVAVFCLSLMGSNIKGYLFEANRILKTGGTLKIAEVESRFDRVTDFIEGVKRFGFVSTWKDLSHNLFYFLDFKKISGCKSLQKLPTISLHPCLYKKR